MRAREVDAWSVLKVKKNQPRRRCGTGKKMLIVFSLCFAIGIGFMENDDDAAEIKTPPVTYTVQSGDTLWDIAGKYKDDGQDIRDVYLQIMTDNHIGYNDDIHPGQELTISRK